MDWPAYNEEQAKLVQRCRDRREAREEANRKFWEAMSQDDLNQMYAEDKCFCGNDKSVHSSRCKECWNDKYGERI